jgi:hypothetical protein
MLGVAVQDRVVARVRDRAIVDSRRCMLGAAYLRQQHRRAATSSLPTKQQYSLLAHSENVL